MTTVDRARIRIGVVGAGGVAARHVKVLSGMDDAQVVGIADLDPERAGRLAAECGAQAWPDAEAMLAGGRPDAVYICVPPGAHGAPEEVVLAAGRPMFVEKPLAADLATAEGLAARVSAAGVITATGYHWRHLDTVATARELLADRPVGIASASWWGAMPPPPWWRLRSGSGGQVVEQATHVLDLLRVLVGEVAVVHASSSRFGHAGPADDPDVVDDATVALLRFRGGAVATVSATCLADRPHRADIELVAGGLALELTEEKLVSADREWRPVKDAREAVDRAFLDALHADDPTLVGADYAEALRTHAVACAIATAARTGAPVRLDGAG
ncbi:MAG: Gfo/Idh/MocA family oxidoreductase [Pseudonocardia sp.]|nr:Gfo/Idh/MocA family oxidoreductase [Pseudonocardia sp.]